MSSGNFMLVGPSGSGKRTAGNDLLDDKPDHPYFSLGVNNATESETRVNVVNCETTVVAILTDLGVSPIDAHVHANQSSNSRYKRFDDESVKKELVGKPFFFLFFVMFNAWNRPQENFYEAAKHFVDILGAEAMRSTILVVIQTEHALCLNEFTPKLYDTRGYKFLKKTNSDKNIPFLLRSNYNPNGNQGSLCRKILDITTNNQMNAFDLSTQRYADIVRRANDHDNSRRDEINKHNGKIHQPSGKI